MIKQAITDDQLRAITDAEMRASVAYMSGKLSEQRRRNEYFFLGLPKGELAPPAIEGRSQVVDTSVRDTVEWMLTSLVKMFVGGDKAVEFAPRGPEDEKSAEQATDYVNYVFYAQNPGYQLLYTAIKDALIQKNGVLKVWWDKRQEDVREDYRCLDQIQLAMLLQQQDIEVVDQKAYPDPNFQPGMPGPDGLPMTEAPLVYDVGVKRVVSKGRVRIENVPPEEFLISRKAKSIEDAPFVAHRVERTISDLRAMGYEDVENISTDDAAAGTMNGERIERRSFDDELPYLPNANDTNYDPSQRIVWLTECYVKADRNGDGIAEWLKVVRAGTKLLDVEECDGPPFVSMTPIPLPHRFFGMAVADLLIQSQMTKTSLLRAALDNFYIGVNGRYFAVEGQVNLDDLLVSRPGGVVRVKQPGAVGRLDAGMGDIGSAMGMLEYVETQKENASGWTRYSQGTSADALNKTATGTSIITSRSDARVELMARNLAETGIKPLFLRILKLVSQYQDKPSVMRLTNEWIEVDPRQWKTQFDLVVNVGLGSGNKEAEVQRFMALHQMQMQLAQAGIAQPPQLRYGAVKIAEAMGRKDADSWFLDPAKQPPQPPPPPPPEVMKLQADMQAKQAQIQADAQASQMKLQADAQLEAQRLSAEQQRAAEEMALEKYKAELKAQTDLQIELMKHQAAAAAVERESMAQQATEDAAQAVVMQAIQELAARQEQASQALQSVMSMVTAPKRVVRDPQTNRVVGVEVMTPSGSQTLRVARDQNGRAVGVGPQE